MAYSNTAMMELTNKTTIGTMITAAPMMANMPMTSQPMRRMGGV